MVTTAAKIEGGAENLKTKQKKYLHEKSGRI